MTNQEIANAAGKLLSDRSRRNREMYSYPDSDYYAEQKRYCLVGACMHVARRHWSNFETLFHDLLPECKNLVTGHHPGYYWDNMTDEQQDALVEKMVNYRG